MEVFKTALFGVAGLSMIFWVAVIGIWHVDMFPRFFKEDRTRNMSNANFPASDSQDQSSMVNQGELRPGTQSKSLLNRSKYFRKSLVVADFSPIDSAYGANRLYTSVLLSLGVMSFIMITYGLHSALNNFIA